MASYVEKATGEIVSFNKTIYLQIVEPQVAPASIDSVVDQKVTIDPML